jgi:hypothetical protein
VSNLDRWPDDQRPLSGNAQQVLRALRWFEPEPSLLVEPAAHSLAEVPLRRLAREAKLSLEQTRSAVEELIARDVPGVTLDSEVVVLRS